MIRPGNCFLCFGLAAVLVLVAVPAIAAKEKDPKAEAAQCVQTAKGPLQSPAAKSETAPPAPLPAAGIRARVGHPAPDFEANAMVGSGFKNIKLSDYKGKWVVLCFYPGDFTFV